MPEREQITGAVLAGGMGRRMGGVDKGLVEVAGKPMVAWTLDAFEPQVGKLLINANRSQAAYAAFGLPIVEDRHEGFQGPLAGLHAVLSAADTPYVAIVPCDTPRLPADLITRLSAALEQDGTELATAEAGGRVHTLHGLFRRDVLTDLTRALADGQRKPDAWYATRRWSRVSFDDVAHAFDNINTPEQRDALAAEIQPESKQPS